MDISLKDRILETVDIVDVVGERVRLTQKGKDYVGLCPFHPDINRHWPSVRRNASSSAGRAGGWRRDPVIQLADRVEFSRRWRRWRAGPDWIPAAPGDRVRTSYENSSSRLWPGRKQHFQNHLDSARGRVARDYAARRGLWATRLRDSTWGTPSTPGRPVPGGAARRHSRGPP